MRIDDPYGAAVLPERSIGRDPNSHDGRGLTRVSIYTVDEVELPGPPDMIDIHDKASSMRDSGKMIDDVGWKETLARIVADTIARNWLATRSISTTKRSGQACLRLPTYSKSEKLI